MLSAREAEGKATVEAASSSSTSTSKKKAKDSSSSSSISIEGVKRSRKGACDSCRNRKIKCLRLEVEGIETGSEICIPCRGIKADCTYRYVPKRPGPQSSKHSKHKNGQTEETLIRRKSLLKAEEVVDQGGSIEGEKGVSLPSRTGRGSYASSSSFASTSASSLDEAMGISLSKVAEPYLSNFLDTANIPHDRNLVSPRSQHPVYIPPFPSSSSQTQQQQQAKSLDDIAPRQTFLNVVSLYYQHLYPLCPVVHQPTFSQDLLFRRDESDMDFLIFVLSLTAYTLVQVPQSLIPAAFKGLQKHCHQTSRRLQTRTYESPKLIHLSTLYLDHIYLGSTGLNNAANAILGEAIRLGYTIGIHDERTQNTSAKASRLSFGMSKIDCELRRRLFFLFYGSDRTIALLQDYPICLRDDDTFGVEMPLAIDDDMITDTAVYPQPPQRGPSVLCGFDTMSRLFFLLSTLLESHRKDQRRPPASLNEVHERKTFINGLLHQLRSFISAMPEVLTSQNSSRQINISVFSTMRVNILMTETMIRFGIADYNDYLNRLQEQYGGPVYQDNDWEVAAGNMVNTLQTVPFESIAANGQSMIAKLLYLTSNLLNRSHAGSTGFHYMCHFLDTLTLLTSSRNGSGDDGSEADNEGAKRVQ